MFHADRGHKLVERVTGLASPGIPALALLARQGENLEHPSGT